MSTTPSSNSQSIRNRFQAAPNIDEFVKGELDAWLPKLAWLPLYYFVYVPVVIIFGFMLGAMYEAPVWTLLFIAGVIGTTLMGEPIYMAVPKTLIGLFFLAMLFVDDDDSGSNGGGGGGGGGGRTRGETYTKWYIWHSF